MVCPAQSCSTDEADRQPAFVDYYIKVTERSYLGLLLLYKRCGRSDAIKRPFLAALHSRNFIRKHNDNGTHDSTCAVCNTTLGLVRIELTLEELERSHLCLEADLVRRTSEPEPLRAKWDGLPGASIRSVGRSACALEETPAESLDLKTIPDPEIGSESSF